MDPLDIIEHIGWNAYCDHIDMVIQAHGGGNFSVAGTELVLAQSFIDGKVQSLGEYNVVTYTNKFPNGYSTVQKALK